MNIDNDEVLASTIYGRVEPKIYAFETHTVPNYLKVGDTFRPVKVRLAEWRSLFPDLEQRLEKSARIPEDSRNASSEGVFFRDYSVHQYLEQDLRLHRLAEGEAPDSDHYSREFFKNATPENVESAIADIKKDFSDGCVKYRFYSVKEHLPIHEKFPSTGFWKPRPNQQEAIDRFVAAIKAGRKNLLMYAVMRFGKSFTSMCCAQKMLDEKGANLVVVVSAKAGVSDEWRKTVESAENFRNDYEFYSSTDLAYKADVVSQRLKSGGKAVVFLTLQDLQGKCVKQKHAALMQEHVDLLLVDETHFGARAEAYGAVLRETKASMSECEKVFQEDLSDLGVVTKSFDVDVVMHLSGTPYRILMGSEFAPEDIVSFCQYSDIVDAQETWDREHLRLDGDENGKGDEWENPYFGFPQMIRFAFNPSKVARDCLRRLKDEGVESSLSSLFEPKSVKKDSQCLYREFKNEAAVLDIFKVIDGSKDDDQLLGFLDCKQIREGQLCQHIVCVLPYCASCDALARLLNSHKFKHLSEYKVLNISGHDADISCKTDENVKSLISAAERGGEKTITLTVHRMLTGSTVPEWDTMLYFKDGSSPQEYDQAVFRLQNQFIREYEDEKNNVIRYNMKPQTLLVDFDVDRMFRLQELRAQIYNANADKDGNAKLNERISRELTISPILRLDNATGKLAKVTPANIMDVVRNYSSSRSIADEAREIGCDLSLFDDENLRSVLSQIEPIDSKKGLEILPSQEPGDDSPFDVRPTDKNLEQSNSAGTLPAEDEDVDLKKKLSAYYARILIFSFLTTGKVNTLDDILSVIKADYDGAQRIAKNLGLRYSDLSAIREKVNHFVLSDLDYRIQNANTLMQDTKLAPIDRVRAAMRKFQRVSDTEIVTPDVFAEDLVGLIPEEICYENFAIVDIASVQGVLAWHVVKRFPTLDGARIYSIPTSGIAYELTRKVYEFLELPVDHVLPYRTSDLLEDDSDCMCALRRINPGLVIGVPPFGSHAGGGRGDGRKSEYENYFFSVRNALDVRYICFMVKATWYTGEKGPAVEKFRSEMLADCVGSRHVRVLHDYPDVEAYAKGVTTLRGGACLFLWDGNYDGRCEVVNKIDHVDYPHSRYLRLSNDYNLFVRLNRGLSILKKVLDKRDEFLPDNRNMYLRNPFGLDEKPRYSLRKTRSSTIKVYLEKGGVKYLKPSSVKDVDGMLGKWKVLIAKASSGEDSLPHRVISKPIVAEPNSITAFTHYMIGGVANEKEAQNLASYMTTRFARFMVYLLRSNQNMRVDMYRFVPRLDFSRPWTDEDLYARYGLSKEEREFIERIIRELDD